MHGERINPQVLIYLNRLSDLLFVLARILNHLGRDDVLWQPGKTAAGEPSGGELQDGSQSRPTAD